MHDIATWHILVTINLYQTHWHSIHDTEQISVHCEVKSLFNEAVTKSGISTYLSAHYSDHTYYNLKD